MKRYEIRLTDGTVEAYADTLQEACNKVVAMDETDEYGRCAYYGECLTIHDTKTGRIFTTTSEDRLIEVLREKYDRMVAEAEDLK